MCPPAEDSRWVRKLCTGERSPPPAWLGVDGTGQTIGLVEFDTFQTSDVVDYENPIGVCSINNLSQVHVDRAKGNSSSRIVLPIRRRWLFSTGVEVTTITDAMVR